MKIKYLYLIIILFGISCSDCYTKKEKIAKQEEEKNLEMTINKKAKEKFGRNYKLIPNNTKDYYICKKESNLSPNEFINKIKFFIYSTTTKEIIFEDEIINGSLLWLNNNKIKVSRIPGMVKKNYDNDNILYYYDVIKKSKLITN
ncbi:MAG: hypothetical protein CR986_07525 [Ignavibacteriae bacterium]|nr:MAG: hypothetical protein CR986_07525 [Ignavibacteriota bacterium]